MTVTDTASTPAELNGPLDLAAICAGEGPLRAAWIYTPIGGMVAVASEDGLHLLEFARVERLKAAFARMPGIVAGKNAVTEALQEQLVAYFAGRRAGFDIPLIRPKATAFTARVWDAVEAVPYATTTTYGALAAGIGAPKAARAVGRANGANPVSILVPCHRITGPDGALTGYAGGLWRKEWLLAHEARGLKNG
jgi:AraC family transcriptional regulator, regulatory protein of adaptative response / methylated-DNA-[protein]-cysteine methyltransferase